jgi:hypothetical protein
MPPWRLFLAGGNRMNRLDTAPTVCCGFWVFLEGVGTPGMELLGSYHEGAGRMPRGLQWPAL